METILIYVGFALGLSAMVLHFVAPRTKNKTDDKLAGYVDKAIDMLPKK